MSTPNLATDSAYLQNNVNLLNAQLALSIANQSMSNENKQKLYQSILANKNSDMQLANSALLAQTNAVHGLYYYESRNNQLNNVNKSLLGTTTGQANALQSDNNLAKRQNEINEWETGNKMDTLFIYQLLLIVLCISVVFAYLWKADILGTMTFMSLEIILGVIFILTVINRGQYTNLKRDTRYWNQRRFPTSGTAPSSCVGDAIEAQLDAISDLGGFGQGAELGVGSTSGI
jgi:hypothetical protein